MTLDDDQRRRYSRHLLLDEWSEEAQERLLSSHALVIGAGGLGAPALMYLAAAGVGRITVIDPDTVDLTNLQRQVLHATPRVGWAKVDSAAHALHGLNPGVRVRAVVQAADEALLTALLPGVDVVLDCTDRFATRQLINRACRAAGVPLVFASALRFDGQLSVFDPRVPGCPCYACLFPPHHAPEEQPCALLGVFAPLVGMVGVMQAGEAIKLLAGLALVRRPLQGQPASPLAPPPPGHLGLAGRLLLIDGRDWTTTAVQLARDPACPVCGSGTRLA